LLTGVIKQAVSPKTQERKSTAVVPVDASHCLTKSAGYGVEGFHGTSVSGVYELLEERFGYRALHRPERAKKRQIRAVCLPL